MTSENEIKRNFHPGPQKKKTSTLGSCSLAEVISEKILPGPNNNPKPKEMLKRKYCNEQYPIKF